MEKQYVGETSLSRFLENLYGVFAPKKHTHLKSDISDFPTIPTKISELINDSGFTNVTIDSSLSDTSTNPVQNKVVYSAIDELRQEILSGSW